MPEHPESIAADPGAALLPGSAVEGAPVATGTRPEDRVRLGEKLAWGSGFLPYFFGNAAVQTYANSVYVMLLHLSPQTLGLILALPRLWDAVTDPVMGYFSDNLHTRWGRRRPLIVLGAILQAVAFGAIWMVPEGLGSTGLALWLGITLMIFYTAYTVFSVPFISLGYEMTPDYDERTRVQAYGGFFGKVGEYLYSWMFPLSSLAVFGSALGGVRAVGWLVAFFIMGVLGVLPGLFVRERYYRKASAQHKVPLFASLKQSFLNRAFVVLVALSVLQILAGIAASSIDYYLIVYYLCDGDVAVGSIWKALLSSAYATVGILAIYPVTWLATHYGKRNAMACVFGLVFIGAGVKWYVFTPGDGGAFWVWLDHRLDHLPFLGFLATPGNLWKIMLDPLFCGPIWIAINVLTPSMFADVCDLDEYKHGMRREGVFGAAFSWIQKTGFSLAFFVSGTALAWVGFRVELGGAQSPETFLSMRLVLALSTALWAVLAIVLLLMFPLTRAKAAEIRAALEARRGRV